MCAERQTENEQEGSDLERKMTTHTKKTFKVTKNCKTHPFRKWRNQGKHGKQWGNRLNYPKM